MRRSALLLPLLAIAAQAQAQQAVVLDGFDRADAWGASASDGVGAEVAVSSGALTLQYDFADVSGYAVARRALPIDWPENFILTLKLRGTGGVNDLQIKFTDADGSNVWWVQRPNFRPSGEWQTLRLRSRDVDFAWGPTEDKSLRTTHAVEIVVVRGRDGGAGTLEVDDLRLEPLPPPGPLPKPTATGGAVLDGDDDTTAALARPLVVDLGGQRELGGVALDWAPDFAAAYRVEASDDGREWRVLRRVEGGDGGRDLLPLPGTEAAWLRVIADHPARLAEIAVLPREWSETPNAVIAALAEDAPRGTYPRGFTEQSYWTLAASDGGAVSALIGEDGAIGVAKGGFSIEPFIIDGEHTVGWAGVESSQTLLDGYLPLPHVVWAGQGWTLDTALTADQHNPRLLANYRLTNTGSAPHSLTLALSVRPFQVNPPAQFLSQQGGVSPITEIDWNGTRLAATTPPQLAGDPATTRQVVPLVAPQTVAARPFDHGALAQPATADGAPAINDPAALGSETMRWTVALAPGESFDLPVVVGDDVPASKVAFAAAITETADYWRGALGGVELSVPTSKQPVADTIRTALAHVLMSRDGPALKPGTRSYARSWIRDGAMMGDTLLRLGRPEPVRAFADWYGTKPGRALVDGRPVSVSNGSLILPAGSATIRWEAEPR